MSYSYSELVKIINNYPIKVLESTTENTIDIKSEYQSNLSYKKVIDYIEEISNLKDNNITGVCWVPYIIQFNEVINILEHEFLIGSSGIINTPEQIYKYISEYSSYIGSHNLILLKWSDGLYTPINIHEPSLPFYVDLREVE